MLQGRTRHDFFEFKMQHHLPLMVNAIGILRHLAPYVFRPIHEESLFSIMEVFWQVEFDKYRFFILSHKAGRKYKALAKMHLEQIKRAVTTAYCVYTTKCMMSWRKNCPTAISPA